MMRSCIPSFAVLAHGDGEDDEEGDEEEAGDHIQQGNHLAEEADFEAVA